MLAYIFDTGLMLSWLNTTVELKSQQPLLKIMILLVITNIIRYSHYPRTAVNTVAIYTYREGLELDKLLISIIAGILASLKLFCYTWYHYSMPFPS